MVEDCGATLDGQVREGAKSMPPMQNAQQFVLNLHNTAMKYLVGRPFID
jgi:hypothetical protein